MDGLKARLSFDAVAYDYDDEYLTIDTDTHTININNVSRLFGVQYDGNSKLIKFRIRNKLSDIQKMQDSIVYINWIDSKGVKGQSIAINKTINNDTCEFAWKVPFDALKNSGVLHFAMSAVVTKNSSSVIDQRWSTQIASVITPDGIYIKSYTPSSEEEDRIAQIYTELSNMINKQNDNLQSQVNSLKEDLVNNGLSVSEIINGVDFGNPYKTNVIAYSQYGSNIGKSIDSIATSGSAGANIYLIDISGASKIKFRVFKTSSKAGSYILDSNKICIAELINSTEDTGTELGYEVPNNGMYLLYSVSKGLTDTGLDIYVKTSTASALDKRIEYGEKAFKSIKDGDEIINDLSLLPTITGTIQETGKWESIGSDYYQTTLLTNNISHSIIVTANSTKNAYVSLLKTVPTENRSKDVDFCISETGRHQINKGETETIIVPSDCKCIAFTKYSGDTSISYLPNCICKYNSLEQQIEKINDNISELSMTFGNNDYLHNDVNRNLCLGGIKTDILTNKRPYHRGFLFHKLINDDKSLWYGNRFEKLKKIGTVDFYPSLCRLAISPKDGRVIATVRDTRKGIYVWDGKTTTLVNGFETEPKAWLYNSGVDFINDENGVEHCIFAEYSSTVPTGEKLYVWRGTYPYTSKSDWTIVLEQNVGWTGDNSIVHFHQIKRDPWTNTLYCTSGDSEQTSAICKWWYSTDYGATWTLLTDGVASGWETHVTRCINFVFTKDYIYWAVDHGTNHCLNRIRRGSNGIIDISTREKLCDLPNGHATNSICYVDAPKGIFMYERVDTGYTEQYGENVQNHFYDLNNGELKVVTNIGLTEDTWGGCRGKCYINYTNGNQPYPAMGFGTEAYCMFDISTPADIREVGTVEFAFDGTIRTVES